MKNDLHWRTDQGGRNQMTLESGMRIPKYLPLGLSGRYERTVNLQLVGADRKLGLPQLM